MNPSETSADEEREHSRAVITIRNAEILVAITLGVVSLITIWSNYQLGAGWSSYGPDAGYFPLRLGVVILLASIVVLVHAIRDNDQTAFLEIAQARLVAVILLPLIAFVFAIAYLGIYVASVIFIAAFMLFLGKFPWWKAASVSIIMMLVFFFVFEIQFKVPLPKGPIENWLGF
ncbi:small permease of tripartite tricarboxylate transporter [Herminiimonas sp. KBW02]|uniref:tripartite tricarboxylate transporter TctB family protein n=1 Tax=Herminiimonas sp. KBW02 TaxID=2153363 RepID=UPI000F593F54|nr:tripartite tricarboxylate transporter TctB family protein [Herminiimonas sp. KBW02]RQO32878.1 small permease of tripartite tricarboxylate transporter [Herminiimonas sp. KBW02]